MDLLSTDVVRNRSHAAKILALKLHGYRHSHAAVISTDVGGLSIGLGVAAGLNLPLRMVPCRALPDPSNNQNSIGSVAADELILHHTSHNIPQDYVWHQIEMLRNSIAHEQTLFAPGIDEDWQGFDTFIIVQDIIQTADAVTAAINHLLKVCLAKVVIACAVMTDEAFRQLSRVGDEMICLHKVRSSQLKNWFPPLDQSSPVVAESTASVVAESTAFRRSRVYRLGDSATVYG